jgi:hypothetical protein
MKTSIAEILRRIRPLAKQHQAAHLRGIIASEQGYSNGKPNIHKTSVRIRELQAALQDVMTRQLKREGRAA